MIFLPTAKGQGQDIWELAATIDVLMKDSVKTLIVGELEEECVGSIVVEKWF